MESIDGKISGDLVKKVYYADKSSSTKVFSKLIDNHFEYDTFDKMKVGLAVQILSESVASGLEHSLNAGFFKSKTDERRARPTINFARNMNVIFDMLNAKSVDDNNPNKRGISAANIDRLMELYDYVCSVEIIEGSTVYWIEGLKQTLKGVIGLFHEIHSRHENFILMSRHLNQDPLENLFGQIRSKGGNNRNPLLLDFLRTISRIMTSSLLVTSKKTNCEFGETCKIQILDLESFQLPQEDTETVTLNYYLISRDKFIKKLLSYRLSHNFLSVFCIKIFEIFLEILY